MKEIPLDDYLNFLKLPFIRRNLESLTQQATQGQWSFTQYLRALIEGEVQLRQDNKVARCIRAARFPVLKNLDEFDWSWPSKINRSQIQELFQLNFLQAHANGVASVSVRGDKKVLRQAGGQADFTRNLSG
jgi:DNA replication protein DnaC